MIFFSVLFGRVGTYNFKVQEQMIVGLSAPQWWAHSVLSLLGPYGLVGHIFPTGPFVGFKFLALLSDYGMKNIIKDIKYIIKKMRKI